MFAVPAGPYLAFVILDVIKKRSNRLDASLFASVNVSVANLVKHGKTL